MQDVSSQWLPGLQERRQQLHREDLDVYNIWISLHIYLSPGFRWCSVFLIVMSRWQAISSFACIKGATSLEDDGSACSWTWMSVSSRRWIKDGWSRTTTRDHVWEGSFLMFV
jgi:hypothetical protein